MELAHEPRPVGGYGMSGSTSIPESGITDSRGADTHAPDVDPPFVPAPTRAIGDSAQSPFGHLTSGRRAEAAVLRVTASATSAAWILALVFSRTGNQVAGQLSTGSFSGSLAASATLLICASLPLLVFFSPDPRRYRQLMVLSATGYTAIISTHIVLKAVYGSSPLGDLHMEDYSGFPAVFFAASLRPPLGYAFGAIIIAASTLLNNTIPLGSHFLLAIAHGEIITFPFLVFLAYATSTARRLDARVASLHRAALLNAGSRTLRETETQFLAHVHDNVLTLLGSVARGNPGIGTEQIIGRLSPDGVPYPGGAPVAVRELMDEMLRIVTIFDPRTVVTSTPVPSTAVTLPASAAAAICDALREAALNSAKHAPDAQRRCEIIVTHSDDRLRGLTVRYSDDGPGFDIRRIPDDRAGLRLSIFSRLQTTKGGIVDIESAPGKGVTVTIGWSADTYTRMPAEQPRDPFRFPPLERLTGRHVTYSPWFAGCIAMTFMGMQWTERHQYTNHPAQIVATIGFGVAVAAIMTGREFKLSIPATCATVTGILIMSVSGLMMGAGHDMPWPTHWWFYALHSILPLLAIRRRGGTAAATFGCVVVIVTAARAAGATVDAPALFSILNVFPTIFAGALVPLLIKRATSQFPIATKDALKHDEAEHRAGTHTGYLRRNCEWVKAMIAFALPDDLPLQERTRNARLLEMRLRDSIRSPFLDVPDLTREVWNARKRGVKVTLLDDLTPARIFHRRTVDHPERPPEVDEACSLAADILRSTDRGRVTVRLMPRGRELAATILTETPSGTVCHTIRNRRESEPEQST
ncbi:hypothetical protein OS128_05490 [Corynebacterium sp. P5848]|uniref:sensor histidine kinase n=1 Tax=Corynebacterium marambiense TaxID=2765364 RepID=UPI0022609DB2|nr:ATP-binding protein [Corynebacterium marambiense]MCX7542365.1 hypothetical protein [Corynebacterium marambiense]